MSRSIRRWSFICASNGKIWSEFLTLVVCVRLLIECLEFNVVTESKEILEARSVVKVFYICCESC